MDLFGWLRPWYIGKPETLLAQGARDEVLAIVATAAKPSTERLHLRNRFADGRRYSIEPTSAGFQMTTNSKSMWRYSERGRKRTRIACVLAATAEQLESGYTRLAMRTYVHPFYLLDVLPLPLFIGSIVVFMPWPILVMLLLIALLLGLSFSYHYYNAAFQAHEMIYFVEQALEGRVVTQMPALVTATADLHASFNEDFEDEWRRFYAQHQND